MYKVPKIIHQTWKNENIPACMRNYVRSWKKLHPDYQYMFWTDHTIRELIKTYYPWFLEYFDSYPHQIMRVDAFRFFVLHRYGGVYADLDLECYKCIDPLLKEAKMLLFLEWPGSVSNAIMGAVPNHPFLEYCFTALVDKHVRYGPNTAAWGATGPKFLTETLDSYKKFGYRDYKLYPSYYFFPIPWHKPTGDQSGKADRYPRSFGAHHWQGTWWQPQPISWYWIILALLVLCLAVIVIMITVAS